MLPIPAGARKAHAGRDATYGIRPEHFEPCAAGEGVAARVTLVEPLGSETQLGLRLGDAQVIALFRERLAVAPGDVLHLRPKAAAVHLFEAGSGVRMVASFDA